MRAATEAGRRVAFDQALANTRIEGHVPGAEFLAECDAVVAGRMSFEEAIRGGIDRVLAQVGANSHRDD